MSNRALHKLLAYIRKRYLVLLGISFLFGIVVFSYGVNDELRWYLAYMLLYGIVPLMLLALLVISIGNVKAFGFIKGIKETSIHVLATLICLFLVWQYYTYNHELNNRIQVTFINRTGNSVSNVILTGRNAKTGIDILEPDGYQNVTFKGKHINYKTDNDFENEIRLRYYLGDEWTEHVILGGFNRWSVIKNDWEIVILGTDSVEVSSKSNSIK